MTAALEEARICSICMQYKHGQHFVIDYGYVFDSQAGMFRKAKVIYPCINEYIKDKFDVSSVSQNSKAFKKTATWKNLLWIFVRLWRAAVAFVSKPAGH